jgi:hypothetical protein
VSGNGEGAYEYIDEASERDYDYGAAGQRPGRPIAFEGRSDPKRSSDERDLHVAIQRAALGAAQAARMRAEERGEPVKDEWYEIKRVRLLVSNPSVKMFSVEIGQGG